FVNKWKHYVQREQIIDNVNPVKESNEFTFNPDAIPQEYKEVFKGEVKPKTFKDEPYSPGNYNALGEALAQVRKTVSYKPAPTVNHFGEGLFKESPVRVRIKSAEDIKKEFLESHAMPPDVVELLEKGSTPTISKPKSKRAPKRS